MINGKTILVTGGTGYFGQAFVKHILKNFTAKKIIVFSRDEAKHEQMQENINDPFDTVRYCVGDIRDKQRLNQVMRGVNIVIHAAALKRVPIIEYNPIEAVKTNIDGALNVIDSCIENNVEKLIGISSDKANEPHNLYGGTKFILEKLFQSAHLYSKNHNLNTVCVRYGNVAGSSGSIIPKFIKRKNQGMLEMPLTDLRMTRFWIDIEQAIDLVLMAVDNGKKGEIFIPKIKSFRISDLIKALGCTYYEVGIREGEKIHEKMINDNEKTIDCDKYYKILHSSETSGNIQHIDYTSNRNDFYTVSELKENLKVFYG